MKNIFIFLLLAGCTFQQTVNIAQSGNNTSFLTQGITTSNFFLEGYSPSAQQKAAAPTAPPSNWNFLQDSTLGGQEVWVTPKKTQQIYPVNSYANYSFTVDVDCPQQPSSMRVSGTGVYSLSLNGKKTSFLGVPYPMVHSVTFSAGNFQCGQNKISVQMLNLNSQSPLALIYSITQDTSKCYQCQQALNQSYYNKSTCGCQCRTSTKTCPSAFKQWLNYPFCRCECALPPCTGSYLRDPASCQCIKPCEKVVPCPIDQIWSEYRCGCVPKCGDIPVQCSQGQIWDGVNCECSCRKQNCQGSQVFSDKKCLCECPYDAIVCSKGKSWSLMTCQCECPSVQCRAGYYQDQNSCECVVSPNIAIAPPPGFTVMGQSP